MKLKLKEEAKKAIDDALRNYHVQDYFSDAACEEAKEALKQDLIEALEEVRIIWE